MSMEPINGLVMDYMIALPRIHTRSRMPYVIRGKDGTGYRVGIHVNATNHLLLRCSNAQSTDQALEMLERELIACVAEIRSKRVELRTRETK